MKDKTRIQKSKFYKEMTKKGLLFTGMTSKGIMFTLSNRNEFYMRFNKKRKSFYKVVA